MPALALSPTASVDAASGVRAGAVSGSGSGSGSAALAAAHGGARVRTVDTVQALQARIDSLQRTTLDTRLKPTHEALADLLPDGGLKEGAAYSVSGSSALIMALLAGPSAAGSWCGVVGMPEFGVEAAEAMGIDLDRLVLVPHPGDQWLTVTASIADALGVIVVKPGRAASDGAVAKLASRLRERGSTLLVLGAWPQTEAMISLTESRWSGLGEGSGYLTSREVTLTVTSRRSGRPVSGRLLMPDPEQGIRRLDPPLGAARTRPAVRRAEQRWREVG
ncbi:hypothetical protein OVN18_12245 [Microcella daejeonensis]|uniref:Protein ImuA n=1 Tax=Microcella daejeonensis TaxID=2994971 RepID=A0A9E8SB75_9MICO|nr:hypothetical protein [Microcella daejeonensis]WAB81292.1 hypothetical protein OVN18_12245 [Microcella daejeonensis]